LTNEKDVLYFKDGVELINIITKTTDEQAYKIAISGRDKVLNNYTWDHVIYNMMNIVKTEGAK